MACAVHVTNGTLDQQEINDCIKRVEKRYGAIPSQIDAKVNENTVEVTANFSLGNRLISKEMVLPRSQHH